MAVHRHAGTHTGDDISLATSAAAEERGLISLDLVLPGVVCHINTHIVVHFTCWGFLPTSAEGFIIITNLLTDELDLLFFFFCEPFTSLCLTSPLHQKLFNCTEFRNVP